VFAEEDTKLRADGQIAAFIADSYAI